MRITYSQHTNLTFFLIFHLCLASSDSCTHRFPIFFFFAKALWVADAQASTRKGLSRPFTSPSSGTMTLLYLGCPSPTSLPKSCLSSPQNIKQKSFPLYTIFNLSSLLPLDFIQTHIIEFIAVSNSWCLYVCMPIIL